MPPIYNRPTSKKRGKKQGAPTKSQLEVRGGRIVATDPRLAGKAEKATGVPSFLAQTLLKAIDKPREFVFKEIVTPAFGQGQEIKSGYELADVLGIGEGLPGKVAGFGLDVLSDPVTYLTAGTGAVGRQAAKSASSKVLIENAAKKGLIAPDVVKVALGKVREGGGLKTAADQSPVVREIAEKVFGTEAQALAGKRQTLSMFHKAATPEELAALKQAGVKTGGIRYMGQQIVSPKTTAKLTAPIAERLSPTVAKVFSRVSKNVIADVGIMGHTFTKGVREAEDMRHQADDVLRGLANDTAKVVGRKNPETVQAFFDKIWRPEKPELWAGKLTPEAEAAAEKWSASFATMLDEAQKAGIPIQRLQNWNGPRVLTKEAREALYGTERLGATRVGATPGFAKHRTIADFDEAQELMKDWLNLKPGEKFFSEDPFEALTQYGMTMNRTTHHSAAMKAFDDAGIRWGDLGKTGNNLKVQELKAAGFGKNGAKPVVEARRTLWDTPDDPRLAKLSQGTRDLLEAEARLTETKIVKKQVRASQNLSASLGGLQRFQHAAYKRGLKAEQALTDLQPKVARYEELKATTPDLVELSEKGTAEVSRLARRLGEIGRMGLKTDLRGAERLSGVQGALDDYTTLEAQVRGTQEGLEKLATERTTLKAEKEGLTQARRDLQAARKLGRIIDSEYQATTGRIAKQAQDLAEREATLAGRLDLHQVELAELRPKFDKLRTQLQADLAKTKEFIATASGYERQAKGLTAQIERAQKSLHAQEIKDIESEARQVKSLINDVHEAARRVAKQEAKVAKRQEVKTNLEAGLDAAGKEFPGPKLSRGEVPEGYQVVTNSGMGIFDQKAWPNHIAKEIETNWHLGRPIFGQEWANFTGLFKKWVTIPFPGFHARNAIGGFFNNFLGGVRNTDYLLNEAIQSGKMLDDDLIPELNLAAGQVRQMMAESRMWSPHGGGGARLADFAEGHVAPGMVRGEPGFGIPGLKQVSEGVEKFGGRAMEEIEQRLRGAAFLSGLRQNAVDPYAARMSVMMRHGDYEELTSFERNVLKQFIPFYKWMRMNVPYQLQSVVEVPGKVKMATGFFQNVVGDPEGQEGFVQQGGLVPPLAAASGAAFMTPGGMVSKFLGGGGTTTLSADLPFYNINQYFNMGSGEGLAGWPSLTGFAADLHPVLRAAQEIVFRKRFYGGGQVGDLKEYSPVGGIYHGLGTALEKLPGGDALAVRTGSGEIRMNSTLLSLLNVLPSSRVAALSRQLFEEGGKGRTALGLGTGLRVTPLDEKSQTIEGYRRQNILDEAVKELYARGLDEEYRETAPSKQPGYRRKGS